MTVIILRSIILEGYETTLWRHKSVNIEREQYGKRDSLILRHYIKCFREIPLSLSFLRRMNASTN